MAPDRGLAAGPDTVVLLGASRVQLGFDPDTFRRRVGRPLFFLSQNGGTEVSWVERLDREGFDGTVIASLRPYDFSEGAWGGADALWEATAQVPVGARRAARTAAARQEIQVALRPDFRWQVYLPTVSRGGDLTAISPGRMTADRSRKVDYRLIESRGGLEGHRRVRVSGITSMASASTSEADRIVRRVSDAAENIVARGGTVAFVRFPTSGPVRELERERFPRRNFWDHLEERSGAAAVHFEDVPTLATFECPDYSHLDARDAPAFTAALLDELERRGVL